MNKVSDDGFCPVLWNDCHVWHLERAEKRQRTAAVQNLAEVLVRRLVRKMRWSRDWKLEISERNPPRYLGGYGTIRN